MSIYDATAESRPATTVVATEQIIWIVFFIKQWTMCVVYQQRSKSQQTLNPFVAFLARTHVAILPTRCHETIKQVVKWVAKISATKGRIMVFTMKVPVGGEGSGMDIHSILDVVGAVVICRDLAFDSEGYGHQHEPAFGAPLMLRFRCHGHISTNTVSNMMRGCWSL